MFLIVYKVLLHAHPDLILKSPVFDDVGFHFLGEETAAPTGYAFSLLCNYLVSLSELEFRSLDFKSN